MVNINNLNIRNLDYDDDYIYIQTESGVIQISKVVLSRINSLIDDNE